MSPDRTSWTAYYRAQEGRAPRPLLFDALALGPVPGLPGAPGDAIDLGCGDGTETLALLSRGWRVLAIDREPEAIARIQARLPAAHRPRLIAQVAAFEGLPLPPADLIYAGFSLPFCPPAHFAALWQEIVAALRAGGLFAGQLFGDRDEWAGTPGMTFYARDAARALLAPLHVERFDEVEERGASFAGPKRWHLYHIIARKPGAEDSEAGLTDADLDAAPADGTWTVRQILEHVLRGERGYLRAARAARGARKPASDAGAQG
jgi:SAM-dependent methyltransferase